MNKYKISEEEFAKVSLKRLANNPSAKSNYDRSKLNAEQLKARMDEPFKLFKDKLNALVALIYGEGDDSADAHMLTGIREGHTYKQLISDILSQSAEFAGYLSVGEVSLLKKLEEIDTELEGKVSRSEIAGVIEKLEGEVDDIIEDFNETTVPELKGKVDDAIASLEGKGDDAIAGLAGKVDDAISNTEQTLMNVFAGNRKHVFTSRERIYTDNALPYSKLVAVEGSDSEVRIPNLIPDDFYWRNGDIINEVTISINDDHVITLNGTASQKNTIWFIHSSQLWSVEPDEYYFSGCPSGALVGNFYTRLKAIDKNKNTIKEWYDRGDGVLCDLRDLEYDVLCVGVYMYEGYSFEDIQFKFQLERGDKPTQYVGKGYSEANKLPTRIEIENASGEKVFEYQVPDGLLATIAANEIGDKGIKIDFENREYIRKDSGVAYDISEYMGNTSRYFAMFPEEYRVKIYSYDYLLHGASCEVVMQHTIGNTLKVGATEISEDVLKSLLALPKEIEKGLDSVISIQNSLIGGEVE